MNTISRKFKFEKKTDEIIKMKNLFKSICVSRKTTV